MKETKSQKLDLRNKSQESRNKNTILASEFYHPKTRK
jgi:hypothetical protein